MLEVGAVVGAGGEQHDCRVGDALGSDTLEILQQHVRVVLDGFHSVSGKQLGKEPHHHLAVFEHVRDPGGDAQIVLEYTEAAVVVANDVDTADVRVDAVGHVDALHLWTVLGVT